MHLSVIDDDAHVAGIAASERSAFHSLHDTFQNSWHETGVDGTADNRVEEDELSAPFEVDLFTSFDVHAVFLSAELEHGRIWHAFSIRLDDEVYLAKLSCATRLLLVTIVGTGRLGDSLAVRDFWLVEFHLYLLVVFESPF